MQCRKTETWLQTFVSVNQLFCFYLSPDRLFGLCNSLLSTHVTKGHTFECVCVWGGLGVLTSL